ncbi:hypothetical protein AWL63_01895 [Sphingomonas panacis]|uniref:Uncharacterized protein n=2 Tax=Sphingomonas panacis TaxID=1560345 RepID=A0A1B3Z657_9SPHN|nr:hypothetical protein AWL63_01895 [Sphingomonas panacis]
MKFALLPLALLAAPVAAQSLSDTHQMRWAPAGKTTPLVSYHPNKRGCTQAAPLHLSGKTPHMSATPTACGATLASAERKTEIAATN